MIDTVKGYIDRLHALFFNVIADREIIPSDHTTSFVAKNDKGIKCQDFSIYFSLWYIFSHVE